MKNCGEAIVVMGICLMLVCIGVLMSAESAPSLSRVPSAPMAPVDSSLTDIKAAVSDYVKLEEARTNRQWTSVEIVLSVAILLFGLSCLLVESFLILKIGVNKWDSHSVSRMIGLTLIITSGLTLVTAGYSSEQMSPVMGLLGTIAGYLLGSSSKGGE